MLSFVQARDLVIRYLIAKISKVAALGANTHVPDGLCAGRVSAHTNTTSVERVNIAPGFPDDAMFFERM